MVTSVCLGHIVMIFVGIFRIGEYVFLGFRVIECDPLSWILQPTERIKAKPKVDIKGTPSH